MTARSSLYLWLAAVVLTACVGLPAGAQGIAGSMGSMNVDTDAPIRVEADSLEVDEKAQLAVFAGSVSVAQERMRLTTSRLEIRYRPAADGQEAQIRTVDARGAVRMSMDDQVATGARAHYDLSTEIMTLSGDVVLSQGENVIRGDQVEVNLKTGRSRVVSGAQSANQGRVRGLFKPNRVQR